MIFFKLKNFIIIIGLFIPSIVFANQSLPPEIPVLFYGNVKIDNNPAPVNTIISVVAEDNNWEIANSAIKNTGKYFIEIPCKNYVNKNIIFILNNLLVKQNVCPNVMEVPSIKFDLVVEKESEEEKREITVNNSIIFPPTPCIKVIYDNWQTACVNNLQYRNVILQIPNNCAMTAEQKLLTQKQCGLVPEIKVLGIEFYPSKSLIRGSDMKIYLTENNKKRHIVSLEALKQFTGMEIFNMADKTINSYPTGNKILSRVYNDGDLIRGKDMKIYVIKNSKKYYIINLKELQKYIGREIYDVGI